MREIKLLVIHHSDSPRKTTRGDVKDWHLARGFDDVGYHRLIRLPDDEGSVEIVEGRPEKVIGAHAKGNNRRSLCLCMIGDFEKYSVPPRMWDAAVGVLAGWCLEHRLDPFEAVQGHKEVMPPGYTTCPGAFVDLERLRSDVSDRLIGLQEWTQTLQESFHG